MYAVCKYMRRIKIYLSIYIYRRTHFDAQDSALPPSAGGASMENEQKLALNISWNYSLNLVIFKKRKSRKEIPPTLRGAYHFLPAAVQLGKYKSRLHHWKLKRWWDLHNVEFWIAQQHQKHLRPNSWTKPHREKDAGILLTRDAWNIFPHCTSWHAEHHQHQRKKKRTISSAYDGETERLCLISHMMLYDIPSLIYSCYFWHFNVRVQFNKDIQYAFTHSRCSFHWHVWCML